MDLGFWITIPSIQDLLIISVCWLTSLLRFIVLHTCPSFKDDQNNVKGSATFIFLTLFTRVLLTVYYILGMQNATSIVNAEVLVPTLSGESNRQQRGTSDDVIDLKPVL